MTRDRNQQQAFDDLKQEIDRRFPPGHAVAIENNSIVADAPSFRELHALLNQMAKPSRDILVVEAGVNLPEIVNILLVGTC